MELTYQGLAYGVSGSDRTDIYGADKSGLDVTEKWSDGTDLGLSKSELDVDVNDTLPVCDVRGRSKVGIG